MFKYYAKCFTYIISILKMVRHYLLHFMYKYSVRNSCCPISIIFFFLRNIILLHLWLSVHLVKSLNLYLTTRKDHETILCLLRCKWKCSMGFLGSIWGSLTQLGFWLSPFHSSCLLGNESDDWNYRYHIGPGGNLKDKSHWTQNLRIKEQKNSKFVNTKWLCSLCLV